MYGVQPVSETKETTTMRKQLEAFAKQHALSPDAQAQLETLVQTLMKRQDEAAPPIPEPTPFSPLRTPTTNPLTELPGIESPDSEEPTIAGHAPPTIPIRTRKTQPTTPPDETPALDELAEFDKLGEFDEFDDIDSPTQTNLDAVALATSAVAQEDIDSHNGFVFDSSHGNEAETTGTARTMSLHLPAEGVLPSSEELATPPQRTMPPLEAEERYELLGVLGRGGMGQVQRVRDWRLNRVVAMKILHPSWLRFPDRIQRFIEEAQATSQLQHPGIVPVHDLGQFKDGRIYFTMKHVVGRTLGEVIEEVHKASSSSKWGTTATKWSFRRLIDAFNRVCEAVGYAHSQGVLHRDLKPDNIMVGDHGEVKVVDWGLVKLSLQKEEEWESEDALHDSPHKRHHETMFGEVKGTPAYMAPEQAAGDVDKVGPPTDVYGLGAILYQILSGKPPYTGNDVRKLLFQLQSEPPTPPGRLESGRDYKGMIWEGMLPAPHLLDKPAIPVAIAKICSKALAQQAPARYANAGEMAREIELWLEGAQKKAKAQELVERAQNIIPTAKTLRQNANKLKREAAEILSKVKPWEDEDNKREGWDKQDEAQKLEWEAWLKEVEAEQKLHAALSHVPTFEDAHAALVSHYGRLHHEAEAERREYSKMRTERYLRSHTKELPPHHPTHQRATAYLSGDGFLQLKTDPPGCQVLLYRYVTKDRKTKPVFVRFLGETPIEDCRLGMGSYLLVLRKEGYEETRYPVMVERMERWDSTPAGETEPLPIQLYTNGSFAKNECYVPGGWYWSGGDAEAHNSLPRRKLWVDSFVIQRYSITNTQYIAFLDDLVKQGREHEALHYAPRERAGSSEEQGAIIYGRSAEGGFVLRPDTEGDIWYPNYPALMIDWFGAQAFAQWFAQKTKRPWRLPSELEWEKAARGVDGRLFPWGDFHDPSWCCMRESRPGRPLPAVIGSHEEDQSPYGVREMAGNVRDWCLEVFQSEGPPTIHHRVQIPLVTQRPDDTFMEAAPRILRVRRGGGWDLSENLCRVASRDGDYPGFRDYMSGFRLARSLW